MPSAADEWNKLCEKLLAELAEEMRLLGATKAGKYGLDPDAMAQFEAACERMSDAKRRMDAGWMLTGIDSGL